MSKSCRRTTLGLALFLLAGLLLATNWEDVGGVVEVKPPFAAPNPFVDGVPVYFVFNAKIEGEVDISVYTPSGLLVSRGFDVIVGSAGDEKPDFVSWDGLNFMGKSVAKGAYLWVVTITDPVSKKVETHKGLCFKI